MLDNILCILFAYATNRRFVFGSHTRGRAAAVEFWPLCGLPPGHHAAGYRHHGGGGATAWPCGGQAAVQTVLDGLFGGALWGAVALWQGGGAAVDHPAAALALWGLGVKAFSNVLVIVLNYLFSKLLIFRDPARRGPQ